MSDNKTLSTQSYHPAVAAILRHFDYQHLPAPLRDISMSCYDLAHGMARDLPGDPELTAGLRKLLEAKDCFVRAARSFE